ncbi:MAG: hypothetical protein HQ536_02650, partial [Parcubacteria group bacterium]|nr:hypothetical protein [Parcubacteria group bacterium]
NKVYLSQAQSEFITKINSKLEIIQKGYYEDEVFGNSGPIPPEVGKPTTYTIIWQAKNYYNDVENMRVKATLSSNARLTGNIFPEGARLTFDSNSREVVWEMENLDAGKGVSGAGPSVSFQVAFAPSVFQQGTTPTIIDEAEITGEDQFTGLTVSAESSLINTTLPDDDTISSGEGVVR